jgi:TctA family transporter
MHADIGGVQVIIGFVVFLGFAPTILLHEIQVVIIHGFYQISISIFKVLVYLEVGIEAAIFLNFRMDLSGGRADHLSSQLSNDI